MIDNYLQADRLERIKALKEVTTTNTTSTPAPYATGSGSQSHGNHFGKSKTEKQLENWDKKKRDKKDFEKLSRNEDYNALKEAFVQQLKDKRMLFFTDPDPKYNKDVITNEYKLELYSRKNEFFWGVLLYIIQVPTARGILNTF